MSDVVSYALEDSIAVLTMDDGKANVLSPAMLAALNAALDRAEQDNAVVLLSGRPGVFSGGFDLKVLTSGGPAAVDMLLAGFALSERLLSFPRPVVIACTGHAVAMGAFVLLSGDHRVGPRGPFRFVANEVAIGLTMPHSAVEILRQRLTPAAFNRALLLAETYSGDEAVHAGFVDVLVDAGEVTAVAREAAGRFAALDPDAHTGSKQRARAGTLAALRAAIERDADELTGRLKEQ